MDLWLELIPAAAYLIEYDLGDGKTRQEIVERRPDDIPQNATVYDLVLRDVVDAKYSDFEEYRYD